MKYLPTVLCFAMSGVLGACNDSPAVSSQPAANEQPAPANPAPANPAVIVDTTSAPSQGAIPFVAPTKIGRILGSQSPSPPASRTR